MTQEHTITPPPELVEQWLENTRSHDCIGAYPANYEQRICTQAARWGADQELKACCMWLSREVCDGWGLRQQLRAARRPKPPSLKEKALETLLSMQIQPCVINGINTNADLMAKYDILRRALESLPD